MEQWAAGWSAPASPGLSLASAPPSTPLVQGLGPGLPWGLQGPRTAWKVGLGEPQVPKAPFTPPSHVYMCTPTFIHIHIHPHTHTLTYSHVCICTHMHMHVHSHYHRHTCTYVHTLCMHVYIHIHTHRSCSHIHSLTSHIYAPPRCTAHVHSYNHTPPCLHARAHTHVLSHAAHSHAHMLAPSITRAQAPAQAPGRAALGLDMSELILGHQGPVLLPGLLGSLKAEGRKEVVH